MPTATWKKSPADLVERFAAAIPAHPDLVRRPMFGYPAAFVRGNMIGGLFEDRVVVRVGNEAAAALIAQGRADPFAPMPNRAMKAFVLLKRDDAGKPAELAAWLQKGLEHGLTMPPKGTRTPRDKTKPARASRGAR